MVRIPHSLLTLFSPLKTLLVPEPHCNKNAPGIDPDIFFDDDGKIWYTGTHAPKDPNFSGEGEIWMQNWTPKLFN